MNENILVGNWKQLRGKVQENWGKLTDDDLDQIEGRRDQIVGLLQKRYGYAQDAAQEQYDKFAKSLDTVSA